MLFRSVKVIGCTNRKDILDPAIVRPGRLDRLIAVPVPTKVGIQKIFNIHTKDMKIDPKIRIRMLSEKMKDFSGAEIKAACTEAGYFAIRKNRTVIREKDFIDGIAKVKKNESLEGNDYLHMFG